MKKIIALLLLLFISTTLCCCAREPDFVSHAVVIDGTDYTVDTRNSTVTAGDQLFTYHYTATDDGYRLTITYPDGTGYHSEKQGYSIISGGNANESQYPMGSDLEKAIIAAIESNRPFPWLMLLPLLLGAALMLFATPFWKLCYAIWMKDATPTSFALWFVRGTGLVIVLLSLHLMLRR